MEKNKYQKIIAQVLGTRPIAFNPDLAKALGSAKAGLFLSQLLYWWEKGSNPNWIYKTIEEVHKETTLSRCEQEGAIKACKKYGLIQVELKGIPAKRHFKLNIQKIISLLSRSLENHNQVCGKTSNKFAKKRPTNTENTSKNTNREISLQESKSKICGFPSSKKKPYFRGEEMRRSQNKWWVIPKDGGRWLEFTGSEKEIEWRTI